LAERDVPVLRMTGRRLEQGDELGAAAHLVAREASAPGDGAGVAARVRAGRDALVARLDGGSAALVVDEAQWLDPASLRVVVGVAGRPAARSSLRCGPRSTSSSRRPGRCWRP
jgi:hypothetical protein